MLRTSHDNEQRELTRSLSGHLKVMNNRKEFSDGILMLIIKIHKTVASHLFYDNLLLSYESLIGNKYRKLCKPNKIWTII